MEYVNPLTGLRIDGRRPTEVRFSLSLYLCVSLKFVDKWVMNVRLTP